MSKEQFQLPENLTQSTRQAWRDQVEKALEGRSIEKTLGSTTYDGIVIKPLYDQDDRQEKQDKPILLQKTSGERAWQIIQLIDIPNVDLANTQIKRDLEGGANALWLSVGNDIPYGAGTLPLTSQADFSTLFAGVDLEGVSLYLTNGYENLTCAAALMSSLSDLSVNMEAVTGSFGFDPLSLFASQGAFPDPEEEALANWVDAAFAIQSGPISMKSFLASGQLWQQAGASEAMELAFTLASALYYARALEQSGFSTQDAFNQVDLSLVVTGDVFLSTAKLRAMRVLWQKICAAAQQTPDTKLIGQMSYLDVVERDPEANMLRATAATVAAGIGNVDGLVLLPFSNAHGVSNSSARRLARNTQIIAQEESHIGLVQDPAAGSWYIESLTDDLCAKAWDLFSQTERAGGIAKMLKKGQINDLIDGVRSTKEKDIATGKKEITGVTIFPNLDEQAPELCEAQEADLEVNLTGQKDTEDSLSSLCAPNQGARFQHMQKLLQQGLVFNALDGALEAPASLSPMIGNINNRLVASFEGLRSVSDYIKVETGRRPRVFLATIGAPSDFTARATWAKSYFEAGGIEAISPDGFETSQALIDAFVESGAHIACLCSSDEQYKQEAIEFAKALKKAGANGVYMVARPKLLKSIPLEERNEIHALLYQGTNMVLTLMEAHYLIGYEDEPIEV